MRGSNEVSVRNKECIEERMERIKNGRGKKRECANQIHKAAMAINSSALAEMDIPETYMSNLPKVSPHIQLLLKTILFLQVSVYIKSKE